MDIRIRTLSTAAGPRWQVCLDQHGVSFRSEAEATAFVAKLEARLRALLRRREPSCRLLVLGPLELDPGTRAVTRDGRPLALTPTCFQILRQLMLAHPRVVGRAEMEQALWGGFPPGSDSLRTHVAALRRELDKPFGEPLLENQYGVGYRLNLPPRPAAE